MQAIKRKLSHLTIRRKSKLPKNQNTPSSKSSLSNTHNKEKEDICSKIFEEYNNLIYISDNLKLAELKIPHLILIGCQSHGKSSFLQHFFSFPLSYIKSGLCTRCPITYQIVKSGTESPSLYFNGVELSQEEILNRIKNTMAEISKTEEGYSNTKILITIKSKFCHNLTIVDLPGLVPGNENKKQSQFVESLIVSYLNDQNNFPIYLMKAEEFSSSLIPNHFRDIHNKSIRPNHKEWFTDSMLVVTHFDELIPKIDNFSVLEDFLSQTSICLQNVFFTSCVTKHIINNTNDAKHTDDDSKGNNFVFLETPMINKWLVELEENQIIIDQLENKPIKNKDSKYNQIKNNLGLITAEKKIKDIWLSILKQKVSPIYSNLISIKNDNSQKEQEKSNLNDYLSKSTNLSILLKEEKNTFFRKARDLFNYIKENVKEFTLDEYGQTLSDDFSYFNENIMYNKIKEISDGNDELEKYFLNSKLLGSSQITRALEAIKLLCDHRTYNEQSFNEVVSCAGENLNFDRAVCLCTKTEIYAYIKEINNVLETVFSGILNKIYKTAFEMLDSDLKVVNMLRHTNDNLFDDVIINRLNVYVTKAVKKFNKFCRNMLLLVNSNDFWKNESKNINTRKHSRIRENISLKTPAQNRAFKTEFCTNIFVNDVNKIAKKRYEYVVKNSIYILHSILEDCIINKIENADINDVNNLEHTNNVNSIKEQDFEKIKNNIKEELELLRKEKEMINKGLKSIESINQEFVEYSKIK